MRTLADARNYFAYHPATPGPDGTAVRHAAVRDLFGEVLERLWPLIPDGPDKTVTIRALWDTQALANLAIALTAPADTGETRSVARVLPDGWDDECVCGRTRIAHDAGETFRVKQQHPVDRVEPAPSSPDCADGDCATCAPAGVE